MYFRWSRIVTGRLWKLIALAVPLCPLALAAETQGRMAATSEEPGKHFIVLVDDSGDTGALQRGLSSILPEYLYTDGEDRLPQFQPGRDQLSLAFFTIHPDGSGSACKAVPRYSVLPQHMFQLVATPAGSVRTRQDFERLLRDSLELSCRRQGNLSPIVTAQSLILTFLAGRLPQETLFSRSFVILAHNGEFNASTSPSYELRQSQAIQSDIDRGWRLRDVSEAERLVQRQASLFRFEQLTDASRKDTRLYLDAFEIQPLSPPAQMQISQLKDILLDRVAISGQQVRITPQSPALAELRIDLPDAAVNGGELVPLHLAWRFEAEEGGLWKIGAKEFPFSEQVLNLEGCAPRCRRENSQIVVPVFDLGGDEPLLDRSEGTPQGRGKFFYRVAFRYDAPDSYGHLYRETPLQVVSIRLAPVERVPGSFFTRDVDLDNGQLAALWQSADREGPAGGLTQEAARNRILQQRKWANLLSIVLAILLAVAAAGITGFYFYKTAYHRPFRPVLEWSPAAEVVIDFDRSDASRLLIGTLTVRNPEEVPWFGQRLGNAEQPTRRARLAVSFQPLESLGLKTSSEGAPIGFLGSGEDVEGGSGLMIETHEAASDGKRVFVFLAGESIKDLHGKNALEADAIMPIVLGIRMEWRKDGRAGGAAEATETVVQFDLRVEPEEPRTPHVEFRPAQKPKLFFRPGQAVEVGHFVFVSRAQHSFARPFTGDYLLQVSRDNIPLGGEPIHLARHGLSLDPGVQEEVPVLLECDGQVIPNPDPQVQSYELRLVGLRDTESDPGPHQVLLYRDPSRAEIELQVKYLGETREIFWAADGTVKQRLRVNGGKSGPATGIPDSVLDLGRPFELRFGEAHPAINALSFQVGNSATAGRGVVEVSVAPRLVFGPGNGERVHLRPGRGMDELLCLYRLDEPVDDLKPGAPQFRVREGEPSQILDLRIEPGHIERIDGAVIEAGQCHAELRSPGLHPGRSWPGDQEGTAPEVAGRA